MYLLLIASLPDRFSHYKIPLLQPAIYFDSVRTRIVEFQNFKVIPTSIDLIIFIGFFLTPNPTISVFLPKKIYMYLYFSSTERNAKLNGILKY